MQGDCNGMKQMGQYLHTVIGIDSSLKHALVYMLGASFNSWWLLWQDATVFLATFSGVVCCYLLPKTEREWLAPIYLKQNQNSRVCPFSSPGAFNHNTKLAAFKTCISQTKSDLTRNRIEMQLVHQLRLDKGAPGYSCRLSLKHESPRLQAKFFRSTGEHDPSKQGILF